MKKSEINAYVIAGVLATSVLLVGCGGGSGGGMGGLGATGATGAAGTAGAAGTNLLGLLGSDGVHLDLTGLGEAVDVRALTSNEVAGLTAAGLTGFENVEVIDRAGEIIGINTPGGAFAVPTTGALPVLGGVTLPALPAGVPRVGILGL